MSFMDDPIVAVFLTCKQQTNTNYLIIHVHLKRGLDPRRARKAGLQPSIDDDAVGRSELVGGRCRSGSGRKKLGQWCCGWWWCVVASGCRSLTSVSVLLFDGRSSRKRHRRLLLLLRCLRKREVMRRLRGRPRNCGEGGSH